LKTPFFNFSAIVFYYNKAEFIVGEPFKDFIDKRVLNVVFSRNLEPESCIVSTMHYARKYNLAINKRLTRWLKDKYNPRQDFSKYQEKRFGRLEFSAEEIYHFVEDPDMFYKEYMGLKKR
jgi:hypothetical protein